MLDKSQEELSINNNIIDGVKGFQYVSSTV